MATVGQQLTTPEAGWRRYDDTDSRIIYGGTQWESFAYDGSYEGSTHYTTIANDTGYFIFEFYGTRLRILSKQSLDTPTPFISIDNDIVETIPAFNTDISNLSSILVYEKQELALKKHTCKVYINSIGSLRLDAIDIDDTGYLIIPDPSNLSAIAGNSQVSLSWDAVSGATGYNVKRSTTAGGPYTAIATGITGTSYVDTEVTNGTTYYYVVTAVDTEGESDNSNEASATPGAPSGHGLLRIIMSDSSEREYELSDEEISQFITWCNRTVGTGNAYYAFNKTYNIGEFKNRKEYLMFEKIISFEVMELTK